MSGGEGEKEGKDKKGKGGRKEGIGEGENKSMAGRGSIFVRRESGEQGGPGRGPTKPPKATENIIVLYHKWYRKIYGGHTFTKSEICAKF